MKYTKKQIKNFNTTFQKLYKSRQFMKKKEQLKHQHFNRLIKSQSYKIKLSQLLNMEMAKDHHSYLNMEDLKSRRKNRPPFLQGKDYSIEDVIFKGFLTDYDIANDLNISKKQADRLLSEKYKPKKKPKIHNTVKLWHILDDKHKHCIGGISTGHPQMIKNFVCGKYGEPKTVVGLKEYEDFIRDYYNPDHSPYILDKIKEYRNKRYTKYDLQVKLAQSKLKIKQAKWGFNDILDKTNQLISEQCNFQILNLQSKSGQLKLKQEKLKRRNFRLYAKPFLAPLMDCGDFDNLCGLIKTIMSYHSKYRRIPYPRYKSKSKIINKEDKRSYINDKRFMINHINDMKYYLGKKYSQDEVETKIQKYIGHEEQFMIDLTNLKYKNEN